MMSTDIAIVRNNFIVYDTGLVRVVRALTKSYSTMVFGWNREGRKDYVIEDLKKRIIGNTSNDANDNLGLKILKLRAPVYKTSLTGYLPLVIFFPIFWTWIFINLSYKRPKIVQACDLDTILPCYIYKKIFRSKLVFYVFDRYAMTFIPPRFKRVFDSVHSAEEFFSKQSDVLVTVDEKVLATFKNKPKHCKIITNAPEDHYQDITEKRRRDGVLTIVYGGHIMIGRGLENIARAMKDLTNVELYMHGLLIDKKLLCELVSIPHITYKGYLVNTDDYYKSIIVADAIIAVYSPDNPSNQITMHNKTYEAMMCGIPIITNLSPEFVTKIGFGIIVDYNDIEGIRSAIVTLRDNLKLRIALGDNGRRAFLEKYNWKETEKELYIIYDNLLARDYHHP
ncbi:MAG TPA: glycosyltransferase [Nitrososphaeraceae archaeon]|nr:glycosyltransferase [Nitrososphaeraceae archaeon]